MFLIAQNPARESTMNRAARFESLDVRKEIRVGLADLKASRRWRRQRAQQGEYVPWGIRRLQEEAMADYTAQTGQQWPENWECEYLFPGMGKSRDPKVDHEGQLEKSARIAGWLRTVARDPACGVVRRLIKRGICERGIGSPRNWLDLHAVISQNPSPQRFGRRLAKVIRRADQILRPYGLHTSWLSLATTLRATKDIRRYSRAFPLGRIGKAAFAAARTTLYDFLNTEVMSGHFRNEEWFMGNDTLILGRGLKEWLASSKERQSMAAGWAIATKGTLREGLDIVRAFYPADLVKNYNIYCTPGPLWTEESIVVRQGSLQMDQRWEPVWVVSDMTDDSFQFYKLRDPAREQYLTPQEAVGLFRTHQETNKAWYHQALRRLERAAGY
jgi:hypothetical protein